MTLPLTRIVAIDGTDLICALGCQDQIAGRSELSSDEEAIVPQSVLDLPVVAETSFSVSPELVLELEPDLVIADEGLSDEIQDMFRNAGIPVMIEMSMAPRRNSFIQNLGVILEAEDKAAELIAFETYYENLVTERVANLTREEKPTVFFEWYMDWFSSGPNSTYDEMIVTAGGINVAETATTENPQMSAEYVLGENPDIILRMSTYLDGEEFSDFTTLQSNIMNRAGMDEVKAVQDGKVYIIKNTALVSRRAIGLLYLAKWFHPTLFADINPSEVHAEMIQKFYGVTINNTFAYPEIITVTDGAGTQMTLNQPIERIVSINSGLTEILCALNCEDKLVGRDKSSTLPPSVLEIPAVADNSYLPNVEMILELQPDILFADSMLPYNEVLMNQLRDSGVPIFIADPSDPEPTAHSNETVIDFSCKLVSTMASIVGSQDIAQEYVEYVQHYNELVKTRLVDLTADQKPRVMLEWYEPYNTFVTPGLDQAGGINIAENQTEYAPVLSAEFVVEQNPEVIIYMVSSPDHVEADFIAIRDSILNRPALGDIDAIKNGKVYVCDWVARGGIRCVVGYLYWAKWCQPTLFADIDPAALNSEVNQKFFGADISGVYAYP